MINTLFSKNPVFMCFGGGGSGGSSAGAASSGGGSRADRKGAAATFSAPKPVYTPPPVVNTSRDRRDRNPVPANVSPNPSTYGTLPVFETSPPVYMQQDNTGGNARTLQLQQDDYDKSRRYIDSLNKSSQNPQIRPKDLSIDPVSMDGNNGALGQVSRYGVYAGDGFEFKDSGQGYQTRTFTGTPETMNNLGQDVSIANELAYGSLEDREKFRKIGQKSFDEGGEFALSKGSANDGDLLEFLKTGSFGASDSFVDQYGLRNAEPVVEGEQVGALSSVASGNAPQFATTNADYTGLEKTYNTWGEDLANAFSINDGASYVRGQLIDDATGLPLNPGDKASSTGKVIRGTFDNKKNNLEGFGGLGAAPILNTGREYLANILVPNDNAAYVDGQLIDTITGKSLEGGGYTTDPVTGQRDYVYGVSDDYSNNLQRDTTGMGDIEARAAIANQVMQRDVPPSDLAYFVSFLPGMTVPLIGGYLGEKMLEGGIEGRRSVIAEQTAALQAGATPLYNDKGEYVGYNNAPSSSSYGDFDAGGSPTTINYDPSSYKDRDRADQESTSIFDQAREDRMGRSDDNNRNNPVVNDIYNRYYKGGFGIGLPDWLRRYASGVSIDELLTKETLDDGTVMYKTPDGKYIDAKYLPNAIVGADEEAQ